MFSRYVFYFSVVWEDGGGCFLEVRFVRETERERGEGESESFRRRKSLLPLPSSLPLRPSVLSLRRKKKRNGSRFVVPASAHRKWRGIQQNEAQKNCFLFTQTFSIHYWTIHFLHLNIFSSISTPSSPHDDAICVPDLSRRKRGIGNGKTFFGKRKESLSPKNPAWGRVITRGRGCQERILDWHFWTLPLKSPPSVYRKRGHFRQSGKGKGEKRLWKENSIRERGRRSTPRWDILANRREEKNFFSPNREEDLPSFPAFCLSVL